MTERRRILALFALLMLPGCWAASRESRTSSATRTPYANWPDPLVELPHGTQQSALACQQPADDRVHDLFCTGHATPTSLTELQTGLGVGTTDITNFDSLATTGRYASLALVANSTSLAARSVSAINPRLIAVRVGPLANAAPLEMLAAAFTRGEQFVEIVATDRSTQRVRFYLVAFRQACNQSPHGCTPGDLLTPAIENNWTEVTLYNESDLTNSVLDCATCHQPDGPNSPKLLRMQEIDGPWTHWFWEQSEGGRALLADYSAAKGDEPLAGMTAEQINKTHPEAVSTLVILQNPTQPNKFVSQQIEDEVKASAKALGGNQPDDNSVPGTSPTWREAYEHAKHGDAIPAPFYDVKITDPAKLAAMTLAYQAYRSAELSAAELPDVRDVLPDDPQRLAELGIGTEPGLDGAGVLLQACAQCHNERLDQTLSRARFRADLQGMDRAEKDLAIARMMLPPTDPHAMPPALLHVLTPEARTQAIETLQQ